MMAGVHYVKINPYIAALFTGDAPGTLHAWLALESIQIMDIQILITLDGH